MTPQQTDPLAQLRDIHLPEAISPWPPAPGWWLLTALLLAVLISLIVVALRQRRRNRYRRLALSQLAKIETYLESEADYLPALNQLLKQTALAAPNPAAAAGLAGKDWLDFLDSSGGTVEFNSGPGQLLMDGPYRPNNGATDSPQLTALHQLAKRWIQQHRFDRELPTC